MSERAFVYLASQTPRRAQLLQQIGIEFRLLLPDANENAEALEAHRAGRTAGRLRAARDPPQARRAVVRLRRSALPPGPVLAADTTVALGRRILGKPADAAEARATLSALSGRTHRVLTAVAVHDGGARGVERLACALRRAFARGDRRLRRRRRAVRQAGAYAIQGPIAAWIAHIDGSHSGIMGLPLYETAPAARWGVAAQAAAKP